MAEYQMTLVDRQRIARGTMAFWFETNGASYEFRAGQHADFGLGSTSDNFHTFSLASSSRDREPIMIAMRMRPTVFKSALRAAALGTRVTVSRPRGSFTLHRDITRPAVFPAGGIGIAPIHSILQSATQERLPHKLYLFYSNREAADAAFMDELQNMAARNPNLTLVLTVTGHKTLAWPHEKGYITREMVTRYLLGLNGPVYYIAGPSRMVTGMTDLLVSSGVSPDDMRTEEFGDYKLDQDSTPADRPIDNNRSNSAP
jgi:ferredoxin-NADP reductase